MYERTHIMHVYIQTQAEDALLCHILHFFEKINKKANMLVVDKTRI